MTDAEFLNWIADRLVQYYGENPNYDYVRRLRRMAEAAEKEERSDG